ncbi:FAD-dependent oxidoreductase [Desulfonatronovibrio hydrogenovorans]|uniref:FAD-dependent oxidoreductase n=1 Tax=Desulfonatronovibrio hydrogenovorans TaxID=53245 RepID=UPI000490ADEB|nr:FAD-dependent oxidoreductase [Desulfonatronovibrio hydrogenovorans]
MSAFFSKKKKDEWVLDQEQQDYLKKLFSQVLVHEVAIRIFTDNQKDPYSQFAVNFVRDLSRLDQKITFEVLDSKDEKAVSAKVRGPLVLDVAPEKYGIRFMGAPSGEEGQSFIQAVIMASTGDSSLAPSSRKILARLKEKRTVQVFVNPQCPYCPAQVVNALKAAVELPGLVSMECIEVGQYPDAAKEYDVGSVPHTVYDQGKLATLGLVAEETFASELVTLTSGQTIFAYPGSPDLEKYDLIIVGAGPAGLTAGIYAARSGLRTVVLEKSVVGGQVALTPVVENYPGFASIPGKGLMEMIEAQAREYFQTRTGEEVLEVRLGRDIEVTTTRGGYLGRAVILATGGTWKKLGVPGEDRFHGRGVSYCAHCDGFFYKDKTVLVVGGGNTALTDALHLSNLGAKVRIVHRRDEFRGEKHLKDQVQNLGIPVDWSHVVKEVLGESTVEQVVLVEEKSGREKVMDVQGVFVAIGINPNADFIDYLGLDRDEDGFISTDQRGRTSIPRVYAAGDVTSGPRQIVTAAGQGAAAAMTAFEDIQKMIK